MNRCTIYCQVVISAMRKNEWEKEWGEGRAILQKSEEGRC